MLGIHMRTVKVHRHGESDRLKETGNFRSFASPKRLCAPNRKIDFKWKIRGSFNCEIHLYSEIRFRLGTSLGTFPPSDGHA